MASRNEGQTNWYSREVPSPLVKAAVPAPVAVSGLPGTTGVPGANGLGVPAGGATGSALVKASASDNDTAWVDVATQAELDNGLATKLTATAKGGYSIRGAAALLAAPVDSTGYYFGWPELLGASTGSNNRHIVVPRSGLLRSATMMFWATGVAGSGEQIQARIRVNNTTNYTVQDISTTTARRFFTVETMSAVPVAAGDTIEFLFACPTWATNPTDVYLHGELFIEVG